MRKLINRPEDFVDEFIDGILKAHPGELRSVSPDQRALVRTDAPGGRVGIVTGGGSGHLPLFVGYVGKGLLSGAAIGGVFSSPSPQQVLAATMASDSGRGVLLLFGNYGGDILNFELAADLAEAADISTATVIVHDDVLSAPPERAGSRRGVGGLVLTYKCAGAAAERGDSLEEVTRLAEAASRACRSVGVGLSASILPAAGKPTFELPEGEMEIGIGIHGEPGPHRGPLEPADRVADRMLDAICADNHLSTGDTVTVLVNGMGATPLEELYIIYRRVHDRLESLGVTILAPYVGEYATSLEMAGASLTLMKLDSELAELIEAPASSPFFRR